VFVLDVLKTEGGKGKRRADRGHTFLRQADNLSDARQIDLARRHAVLRATSVIERWH
jgi:hypothetical protein